MNGGWSTADGGAHWQHQDMGRAVNKIRVVTAPDGNIIFAIGSEVRKLDLRAKPAETK